jgi:hypothetical protein
MEVIRGPYEANAIVSHSLVGVSKFVASANLSGIIVCALMMTPTIRSAQDDPAEKPAIVLSATKEAIRMLNETIAASMLVQASDVSASPRQYAETARHVSTVRRPGLPAR